MSNPEPARPRILILTVPHGASHQRASNALRTALLEMRPGITVEVVNALDHCAGWFRAYYNSYEIPLRYWPSLWGWIERIQDKRGATSPDWLNRRGAQTLFRFIQGFAPDVVIATEVGICELAAMFKREGGPQFRLVGVELMDFHPAWVQPEIDLFLATHEDLAAELVAAGAPRNKVVTCGQPIDPAFLSLPDRESVRKRLGIELDVPLILVLFGGAGIAEPRRILKEIRKLKQLFQVVFITGRNWRLQAVIKKYGRGLPHCCALGWVNNMHEWMVAADLLISKPGGSTLSEAFACGLPMLAFEPHPGNEERICEWIEKWGVGHWVKRPQELAPALERFMENAGDLARLRQRALALARPRAAYEAAEEILKLFDGGGS
jgi:processive 1,2-diacylglycerol beta-glucosyltransferase